MDLCRSCRCLRLHFLHQHAGPSNLTVRIRQTEHGKQACIYLLKEKLVLPIEISRLRCRSSSLRNLKVVQSHFRASGNVHTCIFIYLSAYLSVCLSACLSADLSGWRGYLPIGRMIAITVRRYIHGLCLYSAKARRHVQHMTWSR